MAQIKTNARTIIERGMELRKTELNRQAGIYAVSRRDPDNPHNMLWGVLKFENENTVLSYNVSVRDQWSRGLITIDHLHFYDPTPLERDLVLTSLALQKLRFEHQRTEAILKMIQENKWHKAAEALSRFFSV